MLGQRLGGGCFLGMTPVRGRGGSRTGQRRKGTVRWSPPGRQLGAQHCPDMAHRAAEAAFLLLPAQSLQWAGQGGANWRPPADHAQESSLSLTGHLGGAQMDPRCFAHGGFHLGVCAGLCVWISPVYAALSV